MTIDAASLLAEATKAIEAEATLSSAEERSVAGWTPVDIASLLAEGLEDLETTVLARTDGFKLFYPGKLNGVFGESGSMKSWLALLAAVQEIQGGRRVIYIDYEDSPRAILRRLALFGLTHAQLKRHFVYLGPDAPITDAAKASLKKLIEDTPKEEPFSLVVIDAVTEIMAAHGWRVNDAEDGAKFYDQIGKWFARLGPAVVTIDHVSKSKEEGGNSPLGNQHKKSGIDGAMYRIEPKEWGGKGRHGKSNIVNYKDRQGTVDGDTARHKVIGSFNVKSDPTTFAVEAWIDKPGGTVMADEPATGGTKDKTSVSESLVKAMFNHAKNLQMKLPNGFSKTMLVNSSNEEVVPKRKAVTGGNSAKHAAVDILIAGGYLASQGGKLKIAKEYKTSTDRWASENGLG
ncbi:AAA family ATPase [Micromonospora sp. CA-111912]|uniref:AAA family ATPase n=1 Tax=Micromonospora sp. CA-111912 TaxID=3239955 RepID=UPI003D90BE4E